MTTRKLLSITRQLGHKSHKINKMPRPIPEQTNRYVFTVNDNARAWAEGLMEYTYNNNIDGIKYICGQLEIAPETGNLHFQGYIQLRRSQRISYVKNNIHNTAHWEAQGAKYNGQARSYCTKEDTRAPNAEFIEFGIYTPTPAKRNDIAELKDAIMLGGTHRELIENHTAPYAKYTRFVDRVKSFYRPKAHPEGVKLILMFGEPGTGKTRKAEEYDTDAYVVPINNGTFWVDGYDSHSTVILDDFSGAISKFSLTQTLRLLDRYTVQVPIKGSHVWWTPKTLIVTTNIHPFRWYKWEGRENQYYALWRRFTEVHYFPLNSESEQQDLETFFYDTDMIWPARSELFRELPTCQRVWDYPEENREEHFPN